MCRTGSFPGILPTAKMPITGNKQEINQSNGYINNGMSAQDEPVHLSMHKG